MEGLTIRAYIVAAAMLAVAGLIYVSPRPGKVPGHDEQWMEKVAPAQIAGYHYIKSDNPDEGLCSYKTSKMVYDALAPTVGILARVYEAQGQRFDVQLIASRDRISFHDPRVCFTAQGYIIEEEQAITIKTKTRGDISATFAKMKGPDKQPMLAVYFYRGPNGFYGGTTGLKMALVYEQFKGRTDVDAVFYRFIPMGGNTDPDRLIRFVSMYMDKAGKDSNGYF